MTLNPQIQYVTVLPQVVQLHILNAFFIIALFPFTRLVHLVTFPITYLWRPYQVVIWNRRQRTSKL
ncbi:Nitrate reductase-like protein NarX [Anaerolineae bacterium]|nr:Nitrate reductase-like protein NarX [Anaerolineae bacterium]